MSPFSSAEFRSALTLLTRIPVAGSDARLSDAVWAFPVVGWIIAVAQAVAAWVLLMWDVPAALCAGVVLAVGLVLTGALHEDGLADTADGLWGGWDRARRLDIMRDSRLGSYGALAMILGMGLRWGAMAALFEAGYVIAPLLVAAGGSRAAMAAMMAATPHARRDGLGHSAGHPKGVRAVVALGLACGVTIIAAPGAFAACLLAMTATTVALRQIAINRIGGQTGDILGATQQLAEIAALLVLAAHWT